MTLNYVDMANVVDHIVEIQKRITIDVGGILGQDFGATAYGYMRQVAQTYPKWLNGLSDAKPEPSGLFENAEPYVVVMELQLGAVTQGYDGDLERQLLIWIPYTLEAFRVTPRLQSPGLLDIPQWLLDTTIRLGKTIMPGDIIGAQFILTCETFVQNIEGAF